MPHHTLTLDNPPHAGHWGALLGLGLATAAAAALGGAASVRAAEFYRTLAQPSWAPPASVFGPVWTVLYVLMAVAAWLAVRSHGWPAARPAIVVFGLQLAVNALWSWLFFGWHLGGAAFLDILLLIALVLTTIVMFARLRPLAGLLMAPYLAWILFAAALNLAVWRLNPGVL